MVVVSVSQRSLFAADSTIRKAASHGLLCRVRLRISRYLFSHGAHTPNGAWIASSLRE